MAEKSFYCQLCDCTLYAKNEFDQHCKGKKHTQNQQFASEHEIANRKLFVRGLEGIRNPKVFLHTYFCNFGTLNDISVVNKHGAVFAVVEFSEPDSVARTLKVKHKIGGHCLFVKRFKYRPNLSEMNRMVHQKLEQDEKIKQAATKNRVMDILLPAESLTDQINLLAENLRLEAADERVRAKICEDLRKLFAPIHENCKIYQFGSSVNGFGAKGCDLDLFLDLNDQTPSSDVTKIKVKKLAKIISASQNFTRPLTIPSHRCPVVKFVHKATEIKCDLSVNNRKALHNSYLLRLYSSDPRVHKLVSVIRLWAKTLELAGSTNTAHLFTSYSITLIVLYFVMHRKPHIIPLVCDLEKFVEGTHREIVDDCECITIPADAKLPPSDNKDSEVDLVKGFFAFYSDSIDWDSDALVLKDATKIPRCDISKDPNYIGCKTACMTVLDPFVLTHNVVGNVNEKTKIRFIEELKRAAEMTREWPDFVPKSGSDPWGIAALLLPSVSNTPKKQSKKSARKAKKASNTDQGKSGDTAIHSAKPSTTRVEGEQENGEFCITIQPLPQTMSCSQLLVSATECNTTPAEQWCIMAQEMILCILKTVFLVQVEETDQNVDQTKKSEKEGIDRTDKMNITEEENTGCVVKDFESRATDGSQDRSSEMEDEVHETSFGKRTSDAAHLDGSNIELMDDSPSDSGSLTGDNNPKKRFCDGVSGETGQSCREMIVDKNVSTDDFAINHSDNECKRVNGGTIVLGDLDPNVFNANIGQAGSGCAHVEAFLMSGVSESSSAANQVSSSEMLVDSSAFSGAVPQIKTSKIVTYFCKCRYQLWMGRRKLATQLLNKQSLSGLALEQVITKLALKKQNQISNRIVKTEPTVCLEEDDRSIADRVKDPSQKRKVQIKDQKIDALLIHNEQICVTAAQIFQKNTQKNRLPITEFSCQILHQNCDVDFKLPHILIKLRPTESSCKQFKNFYCCFRSQVLNLVIQHFLDIFN